jgi:hypothetical protein
MGGAAALAAGGTVAAPLVPAAQRYLPTFEDYVVGNHRTFIELIKVAQRLGDKTLSGMNVRVMGWMSNPRMGETFVCGMAIFLTLSGGLTAGIVLPAAVLADQSFLSTLGTSIRMNLRGVQCPG